MILYADDPELSLDYEIGLLLFHLTVNIFHLTCQFYCTNPLRAFGEIGSADKVTLIK